MGVTHETLSEIRILEEQLTNPGPKVTRAMLAQRIAPEFREFGSSGRIYDADTVLAAFAGGGPLVVQMEGFRVERIASDVLLVTYIARSAPGPRWRAPTLRSSLWRRREGQWQVVFHQGTPMPMGERGGAV